MTKIVNGYSTQLNPAVSRRNFNLKYFNVGLGAVLAALGAFYLVNISHLTVQGFVLRDLKSRATELYSAKMDKEEAVNQAQSYNALEARTPELKMVAIDNVEYLAANNLAVAKK
jgi:hypothetical protein